MKKISKKLINKISAMDINLVKNYKLYRTFNKIVHVHFLDVFTRQTNTKIVFNNQNIPIRVFYPKNYNKKLIVYFHGGGWVVGSIDTYNHICSKISSTTNCMVVSVGYSLAPEHKFPVAINECYEVVKYLTINKSITGIKFDEIILMGDSAGGNLAAVVSLMSRDKKEFEISKQILMYPVTHYDHSINSPFLSVKTNGNDWLLTNKHLNEFFDLYASNKKKLTNPYISPILSDDLSKQPKTLIITAELDPLRDEGIQYGEKLREFNNDVTIYCLKETIHGFFNYRIFKNQITETLKYINEFLK